MTTTMKSLVNVAEVQRAYDLLIASGSVAEVRVLEATQLQNTRYQSTASGYFSDAELASLACFNSVGTALGFYITLNPIQKDLLARANNRLKFNVKETTNDKNVTSYRWLMIDADPERASGISSTDEEHDLAHETVATIRTALNNIDWPEPIVADSGNGFHLLYRINLEVTQDNTDLLKRTLQGLNDVFSTPAVNIDTTTYNPARITKLYGTRACKGDSTSDRPHRMSSIIHAPEALVCVSQEQLEAIARPIAEKHVSISKGNAPTSGKFDLEKWIAGVGIHVLSEKDAGYALVRRVECPFNPQHTNTDAAIYAFPNGGHTFKCSHASCSGNSWAEYKGKYEPGYKERKEKSITKNLAAYVPAPQDSVEEDNEKISRPKIVIGDQLHITRDEALQALRNAHSVKPQLFVYMSNLSSIGKDEEGHTIIMPLGIAGLRNELTDIADFYKLVKVPGTDGEYTQKDIDPPKDLAEQILALAPHKWKLPTLRAIVEAPVLRPDGTILDTPGYDEKTKLYYSPAQGMTRCNVPATPTQAQAIEAMAYLKEIFSDFPFESQSDYANTLGLLMTPFVRYAIKSDIQMAIIDANNAGTGKGHIANVVSISATGDTTSPISAKRDDVEWAKSILAKLLQSPPIVLIDNIRGTLESTTLEMLLTGGKFTERILGLSKNANVKNEATWMCTGNNLIIGGDLARRCYRIRLISADSKPEERTDIKIKDLREWTLDNRPEIVTAILTVARAWYVAGKPKATTAPTLGTFTNWCHTIAGMLAFSGITGFQDNRDDLRSKNNEEAAECAAFLSAWHDTYNSEWKFANEIANALEWQPSANEYIPSANVLFSTLPMFLKKALAEKPKSFSVTLAIWLSKRVQTVYGTPGYHLESDIDTHTKAKKYKVVRRVAEGYGIATPVKITNSTIEDNHIEDLRHNPPQPSALQNTGKLIQDKNVGSHRLQSQPIVPVEEETGGTLAEGMVENGPFAEGTKINALSQKLVKVGSVLYAGDYMPVNEYLLLLSEMLVSDDLDAQAHATAEINRRLASE